MSSYQWERGERGRQRDHRTTLRHGAQGRRDHGGWGAMFIQHGGFDGKVAKNVPQPANVHPGTKRVDGESVPEGHAGDRLVDAGALKRVG